MATMNPARSWLFVPANQTSRVHKAFASAADVLILDLEDSVPDAEKARAREALLSLELQQYTKPYWLRINARGTSWREADLAVAKALPGLVGVFLPKVEGLEDIPEARCLVKERAQGPDELKSSPVKSSAALEASASVNKAGLMNAAEPAGLRIGLLVESARGVMNLHSVLSARPEVQAVMFGGAQDADLMRDLGCAWSIDGPELMHAKQHTLLAVRAAQHVRAIDGVFAALENPAGLEQDTRLSRRLGYRARAVVHPAQIEAVNQIYAPDAAELAWAQRVLHAFEEALEQGRAAARVDGRMVDYAMYKSAQRVLGQGS